MRVKQGRPGVVATAVATMLDGGGQQAKRRPGLDECLLVVARERVLGSAAALLSSHAEHP